MSEARTEQQLRESLHGLSHRVLFSEAMPQALADMPQGYGSTNAKYTEEMMGEHGFPFPTSAMPDRVYDLPREAISEAAAADDPFLALWSKAYVNRVERDVHFSQTAHRSTYQYMSAYDRQREQAMIESLPVLHGTSFEATLAAMRSGHFLTNRQLHDQGMDVTQGVGATLLKDRQLGLDNYIFGDFGRLHSSRGTHHSEVVVVFEPSIMDAPGSFLTTDDIEDYSMYRNGVHDMRLYMGGVVLPTDFYKVAHEDIRRKRSTDGFDQGSRHGVTYRKQTLHDFMDGRDAELDMSGRPMFSTWEVKTPEARADQVRKLLFTKPEQHAQFMAEFGDSVPSELVKPKDIAAGRGHGKKYEQDANGDYVEVELRNMQEIFGTYEVFERRLNEVRDEELAERKRVVDAAGEAAVSGYVVIEDLRHASHPPTLEQTNPRGHMMASKLFPTMDELKEGVAYLGRGHIDDFELSRFMPDVATMWDDEPTPKRTLLEHGRVRAVSVKAAEGEAYITGEQPFDVTEVDIADELKKRGAWWL